jgi:hypothetical protein
MANESEYGNLVQVAAYVAANVHEYDRPFIVGESLVTHEDMREGSRSTKFKNKGNLTAYVVAESGTGTKSEYTETSVTLSLQKAMVYFEPTHEARKSKDGEDFLDMLTREAGDALMQKYEQDLLGLANGFTASAGSTGVDLTVAVFKEAVYKASLNDNPDLVSAVLHDTQIYDLGNAIIAASASYYTNKDHDVTDAQHSRSPYVGTLLNTPVYRSNNVESINSGADWAGAVFSPKAIASIKGDSYEAYFVPVPSKATIEGSIVMDYQVGEWVDAHGAYIISDQ